LRVFYRVSIANANPQDLKWNGANKRGRLYFSKNEPLSDRVT